MANCDKPKIIIVGNCCSGKSTLAQGLQQLGFDARGCPQEHSVSPTLWKRRDPDIIIALSCSLATARSRRKISWGENRLSRQRKILQNAVDNADVYINTDELSVDEVVQQSIEAIKAWREQYAKKS